MPVITIISDWNNFDHYLGSVKGKLLTLCQSAGIVDINHAIKPYDIYSGAFVLKSAYNSFQRESIHLVCISTDVSKYPVVIVKYDSHFFIGPDNGFFSILTDNKPSEMIEVSNPFPNSTFIELDLYPLLAKSIYRNASDFYKLGKKRVSENIKVQYLPTYPDGCIRGIVLYIDSFGNAITNINKKDYYKFFKDDSCMVFVGSKHNSTMNIRKNYGDIAAGEIVALFNSLELLEIAINNGNISELLALEKGSVVIVTNFINDDNNEMGMEVQTKDNIKKRLSSAYGYN